MTSPRSAGHRVRFAQRDTDVDGGSRTAPDDPNRWVAPFVRAGVAVAGLVVAFSLILTNTHGTVSIVTSNIFQVTSSALAAVACLSAARRQPQNARGWRWLGASAAIWSTAAAFWTYEGITLGGVHPFPSPADAGFLLFSIPAAIGLLTFPVRGAHLISRARSAADGALIASSVFLVSWALILDSKFHAPDHGIGYYVNVAYPVVDVCIVALVIVLFIRQTGTMRLTFGLFGVGLTLLALSDGIYASDSLQGNVTVGTVVDVGWVVCWLAVGLATLTPSSPGQGKTAGLNTMQELTPFVPVSLAIIVVTGRRLPVQANPVMLVAAVATMVLVAVRQVLLAREHQSLVEQRVRAEADIVHQAFHDSLTGLSNRLLFQDRLGLALTRATRSGSDVAVLFLDLDDFKDVNDSLGHGAGDAVLMATADRLRGIMRPEDTVARFGGDEFALLIEDCRDKCRIDDIARRVSTALTRPLRIQEADLVVGVSVGIAVGNATHTVDDVLRDADLAMYVAKSGEKGGHVWFTPEMHRASVARLEMVNDLRQAVDSNQFIVLYQPKVGLADGRTTGFEALVRWDHPRRGIITPDAFIPLAEATGLIGAIGDFVLGEACRQLAVWMAADPGAGYTMAVNISARQLMNDEIVDQVRRAIADSGIPPWRLELEITETAVMENVQSVIPLLLRLKAVGITLALDDFGTGHSSLNYLKQFPIDCLKIDKSFVVGLGRNEQDAALVRAVIALAKSLGMSSVAEGVETFEQLIELDALGCNYAQGYYLGRPSSPSDALSYESPVLPALRLEHVLVCDDDAVNRQVNRLAFEMEGVVVTEAVDGVDCLRQAHALQPDLIVLDLTMPTMGGLAALPLLREACPLTSIMIVSSTTADDVVDLSLEGGAVAFFDKVGFAARIPALMAEHRRLPHEARVRHAPGRDGSTAGHTPRS